MSTPALPRRHGRKLGAIVALSGLAATLSAYGALDVTSTTTILATPAIWLALLATYLLCALMFTPLARQNRQLATRHVRHGKLR